MTELSKNIEFTDEILSNLMGYYQKSSVDNKDYELQGIIKRSYEEMLESVGVSSPEGFLHSFSKFIIKNIREGRVPEYVGWCSGRCCSSALAMMVVESEKRVIREHRLHELLTAGLKGNLGEGSGELVEQVVGGIFKEGYRQTSGMRVERLIKEVRS